MDILCCVIFITQITIIMVCNGFIVLLFNQLCVKVVRFYVNQHSNGLYG